MTKKLIVLGKNLTAADSVAYFKRLTDWEIEWRYEQNSIAYDFVYDSKEIYPRFLYDFLNFRSADLLYLNGGVNFGNHKQGWGSAGTPYLCDYPPGMHGYGFDNQRLLTLYQDVVPDNRVTMVEGIPNNPEELDTDFILDCRDLPDSFADYTTVDSITTNRILLKKYAVTGQTFFDVKNHARQHGWLYVVPTMDQIIVGYIFNSQINSDQDIETEFAQVETDFDLSNPTSSTFINFQNYYRNSVHAGRISYNSHMAFNGDPLDTASHSIEAIINQSALGIWQGNFLEDKSNVTYINKIKEHFHTLCIHYMAGSVYNTPFWANAKTKALEGFETFKPDSNKFNYLLERVVTDLRTHINTFTYGSWHPYYFHINIKGLGLEHLLIPRQQF
jgi:hypothetical protein